MTVLPGAVRQCWQQARSYHCHAMLLWSCTASTTAAHAPRAISTATASTSLSSCTVNNVHTAWLKTQHNIQIVTGIEVNSESNFPKLREYCPSAEGTRAIFPQLREIWLTIDRWWQSLFVLLYLWSKWRRNWNRRLVLPGVNQVIKFKISTTL